MQRARTEQAKDQRRNTLLHAALNEFFDKGFTAARMEDIAKLAHVSKGTLYLYFANKQDLFRALIEEIAVPTINLTSQEVLATKTGEQALQFLLQSIAHIIRNTPLPKLVKVIIADGKAFPELVTYYREQVLNRMFSLLETIITKAVEAKEWQCSDIPMTARLIIAPVIFSVVWRMVFESSNEQQNMLDLDALIALHTKHLLVILKVNWETKSDKS
ncbi:MAG: TetR/AcrR family transcriptional regulator [Paraglaciecola sp.]|nr:TetR/AcrR family transcriptional regulator [Paraglaciecola sp.]